MTASSGTGDPARHARQFRTVLWVMSLATVGLIFDGYDLVVYGACVSTFLPDPTQRGPVTPASSAARVLPAEVVAGSAKGSTS